jgi:hypothetical protein
MLPLPIDYINTLHHGEHAPVGIDDKVWSENPDGSIFTIHRKIYMN